MTAPVQCLEITLDNLDRAPVCGIKDPEHEGRRAKERWRKPSPRQSLVGKTAP